MPRTPNDGSIVTRAQAKAMIQRFQTSHPFGAWNATDLKGGFHGRNRIQGILDQPDCVGIRYYFGINSENKPAIVLVGEDSTGKVLSDGVVVEEGPLCPPFCGLSNSLDS